MAYFNGDLHYNSGPPHPVTGERQYVRMSRLYCDTCAETEIPLPAFGRNGDRVGRHWDTGFRWAPMYGGDSRCMCCNKPC